MPCTCIIIDHYKNSYAHHMRKDGTSAFAHVKDIIKKIGFSVDGLYILRVSQASKPLHDSPDISDEFEVLDIQDKVGEFLDFLYNIFQKHRNDNNSEKSVCIVWGDNMFAYAPLFETIYEIHNRYHAHYSFAEGYPIGVTPEFIEYNAISMLKSIYDNLENSEIITQGTITRDILFKVLEHNINDFDIETVLSKEDMREYRWSFTGNTRRNFTISKRLWESGLRNPNDILDYFQEYPHYFRGVPSYIQMQVTNVSYPCIYQPSPLQNSIEVDAEYIEVETFKNYIKTLYNFSPEAILSLGYNGEIFDHPQIGELLGVATEYFSSIYVETKGINWKNTADHEWWKNTWVKNITWIVSIDAYYAHTYREIHFRECNEVLEFMEHLKLYANMDTIYAQAVRMNENEQELELFINHWKESGVNGIIQKYNDYCKQLPNKKVVDLSPLTRNPCFHLSNDLVINMYGEVLMCAQSIGSNHSKEHIISNLNKNSISEVWESNTQNFVLQAQKQYHELCSKCDEYYIFNG